MAIKIPSLTSQRIQDAMNKANKVVRMDSGARVDYKTNKR